MERWNKLSQGHRTDKWMIMTSKKVPPIVTIPFFFYIAHVVWQILASSISNPVWEVLISLTASCYISLQHLLFVNSLNASQLNCMCITVCHLPFTLVKFTDTQSITQDAGIITLWRSFVFFVQRHSLSQNNISYIVFDKSCFVHFKFWEDRRSECGSHVIQWWIADSFNIQRPMSGSAALVCFLFEQHDMKSL